MNFAVKSDVAIRFLADNGVSQAETLLTTPMEPPDLADAAKRFTVFVRCERRPEQTTIQAQKAGVERSAPESGTRVGSDASSPKQPMATRSRCAQLVSKKYVYIYGVAERETKISACMSSGGKDY